MLGLCWGYWSQLRHTNNVTALGIWISTHVIHRMIYKQASHASMEAWLGLGSCGWHIYQEDWDRLNRAMAMFMESQWLPGCPLLSAWRIWVVEKSCGCIPAENWPSHTQTKGLAFWSYPRLTPGLEGILRENMGYCPCKQVHVNFFQDRQWIFAPRSLRLEGHPLSPRSRSPLCSYRHLSSKCLSSCFALCEQAEQPLSILLTKPPSLHKKPGAFCGAQFPKPSLHDFLFGVYFCNIGVSLI